MERLIGKGKRLAREARESLEPILKQYKGQNWETVMALDYFPCSALEPARTVRCKEAVRRLQRWVPKTDTVPEVSSSLVGWAMRLVLPTEEMALLNLLDWTDIHVDAVQEDIKDYVGPDKLILDFLIDSIRERTADGVVAPHYGRSKGQIVRYRKEMGERFPLRWFLYQKELFDLMTEIWES